MCSMKLSPRSSLPELRVGFGHVLTALGGNSTEPQPYQGFQVSYSAFFGIQWPNFISWSFYISTHNSLPQLGERHLKHASLRGNPSFTYPTHTARNSKDQQRDPGYLQ